jgi:hypothetical protein
VGSVHTEAFDLMQLPPIPPVPAGGPPPARLGAVPAEGAQRVGPRPGGRGQINRTARAVERAELGVEQVGVATVRSSCVCGGRRGRSTVADHPCPPHSVHPEDSWFHATVVAGVAPVTVGMCGELRPTAVVYAGQHARGSEIGSDNIIFAAVS